MSPHAALRLALVNDHEVVVRGLERMLEDFPDRVSVVELEVDAPVMTAVDVALYDTFAMVQTAGQEIQNLLGNPLVRHTVVYSWNHDAALAQKLVKDGVKGYLSKSLTADALVDAIERIAAGEVLVEMGKGEAEAAAGGMPDWPGRQSGLTAREAEVVALITMGMSNQDIADRTRLSINSIKSYIRSAYRRMGVESRSQAVLWGIANGLGPESLRSVPR